jgi:hypothetical protein
MATSKRTGMSGSSDYKSRHTGTLDDSHGSGRDVHPLLDPRFEKLRLFTIGKQYVPRLMLYQHCMELGVDFKTLSAATGGRFSAEFFKSLGERDPDERWTNVGHE